MHQFICKKDWIMDQSSDLMPLKELIDKLEIHFQANPKPLPEGGHLFRIVITANSLGKINYFITAVSKLYNLDEWEYIGNIRYFMCERDWIIKKGYNLKQIINISSELNIEVRVFIGTSEISLLGLRTLKILVGSISLDNVYLFIDKISEIHSLREWKEIHSDRILKMFRFIDREQISNSILINDAILSRKK